MVNSGVVAAIHVAGMRCDPCGAMRSKHVGVPLNIFMYFNLLKPNDIYICRTATLTSRSYILNIY